MYEGRFSNVYTSVEVYMDIVRYSHAQYRFDETTESCRPVRIHLHLGKVTLLVYPLLVLAVLSN